MEQRANENIGFSNIRTFDCDCGKKVVINQYYLLDGKTRLDYTHCEDCGKMWLIKHKDVEDKNK